MADPPAKNFKFHENLPIKKSSKNFRFSKKTSEVCIHLGYVYISLLGDLVPGRVQLLKKKGAHHM